MLQYAYVKILLCEIENIEIALRELEKRFSVLAKQFWRNLLQHAAKKNRNVILSIKLVKSEEKRHTIAQDKKILKKKTQGQLSGSVIKQTFDISRRS